MCCRHFSDYAMLILALWWPEELVRRVFFVMQAYLTTIWKLSFTHAAAIMNLWEGTSLVLQAFFVFIADYSLLGDFKVVVISSISSTVGIGFVALSVWMLDQCRKHKQQHCVVDDTHRVLFYMGMVLTAVGRAGLSVSVQALHDLQVDSQSQSRNMYESIKKWIQEKLKSFRNCISKLASFILKYGVGSLLVVSFVKKWTLIFGIPAIYRAYITILFFCCLKKYKRRKPNEVLTTSASVWRVFVAAALKKKSQSSTPNDANQKPSSFPRCLDKAVTASAEGGKKNISEDDVKAAKFVFRMVLISITFMFCGIVSSIGKTYFVEQANQMNREVGKWNVPLLLFQLPMISSMYFIDVMLEICFKVKDRLLDGDSTRKPSDLSILSTVFIGLAMLCAVLCCIIAAIIEKRRLRLVRSGHPPMHAAWLIFQFILLGYLDGLFMRSVQEFYKDQVAQDEIKKYINSDDPAMVKRYIEIATNLVSGLGDMLAVLSVIVMGKISEACGKTSWFRSTINESRLDRYYWFLSACSAVSLVAVLLGSRFYVCNARN